MNWNVSGDDLLGMLGETYAPWDDVELLLLLHNVEAAAVNLRQKIQSRQLQEEIDANTTDFDFSDRVPFTEPKPITLPIQGANQVGDQK